MRFGLACRVAGALSWVDGVCTMTESIIIFDWLRELLAEPGFNATLDHVGFLVGVGVGALLVLLGGAFLVVEWFAALAGRPHLSGWRGLMGCLMVMVVFVMAALVRGMVDGWVGFWGQLLVVCGVMVGMLGLGAWMVLGLPAGRSWALAPIFSVVMAPFLFGFNFAIWPELEGHVAGARASVESIDWKRFGFGDDGEDSMDALEARMGLGEGEFEPMRRALAKRETELQEIYAVMKTRYDQAADWDAAERAAYQQQVQMYQAAVDQLNGEKARHGL